VSNDPRIFRRPLWHTLPALLHRAHPSMPMTHRSASTALSTEADPFPVVNYPRYRDGVFGTLDGNRWTQAVEQVASKARARLLEGRRSALAPTWEGAAYTTAKTVLFLGASLFWANQLWKHGLGWTVPPLLLVAGMAFYGALSILHDCAHDSFLPAKRGNAVLGNILAPLLCLEFASFRRSHLEHHRFSQSTADPKRFGAEQSDDARLSEYRTVDHVPALVRPFLRFGAALSRPPLRVRHLLYLGGSILFMGIVLLSFGGDFSLPGRDWRRPGPWVSLLFSISLGVAVYAWSPSLFAISSIALLIGYACVFSVFAGHVTPNQVYWLAARKASVADALNVSDIHFGRLARWLGHGFSDHHSTHHISPSIPCYRLAEAAAQVASEIESFRAPPVDLLDAAGCALVFDSLFLVYTGRWRQQPVCTG
jgi:acyl-lipid omega-6 desaturase (Delta-12 desaturase)